MVSFDLLESSVACAKMVDPANIRECTTFATQLAHALRSGIVLHVLFAPPKSVFIHEVGSTSTSWLVPSCWGKPWPTHGKPFEPSTFAVPAPDWNFGRTFETDQDHAAWAKGRRPGSDAIGIEELQ